MRNLNVEEVEDAKTRLYSMKSMSDLRDFSAKWLKRDNCVIQGIVGKDQRD